MNRCHVCASLAINADAALCLTCSGRADRGEVVYDPNIGWVAAPEPRPLPASILRFTRSGGATVEPPETT